MFHLNSRQSDIRIRFQVFVAFEKVCGALKLSLITPGRCFNSLRIVQITSKKTQIKYPLTEIVATNPKHFLTQVHFTNTEKPKQHSSLLVSCCRGEVFSQGATSKQNLSSMCIHCNAKQISNASASLKALLSITMSRALKADGPLERESGTCGEVPDGLKRPLGTLNIK